MEYLLTKYRYLVRMRAKNYFLFGADHEDLIQEGMIGLYKAVRDFRAETSPNFRAFAELCIARQIVTAIKTRSRFKHMPLNQYVSLDKPIYRDDENRTLVDVLEAPNSTDPEMFIIRQELTDDVRRRAEQALSELEIRVFTLYLEDKTYAEMAKELGRHAKSIDNALQRVKRKIERNLKDLSATDA